MPEAPHSVRQCWRALARCGACSRTLAFLDPLVARRNAWRAGQPEMWRCKQVHSCRPTRNSMCTRGARCALRSWFSDPRTLDALVWHGMVHTHGRPTRGGRGNPRGGDLDRRTAVVRLGTAYAHAARAAGPVLGLSHFSTRVWHGLSARSANAWREGQPEMRRCKQAGSCPPTEIRRRNGAASLPTLGVRSHRCLHT